MIENKHVMGDKLREKVGKLSEKEIFEIRSNLAARITKIEQEKDRLLSQGKSVSELIGEQDRYGIAYDIAFRLLRKESANQIMQRRGLSGEDLLKYYQVILEMNY